jgi:hypothetical protein
MITHEAKALQEADPQKRVFGKKKAKPNEKSLAK